jgi:hypothetical protein
MQSDNEIPSALIALFMNVLRRLADMPRPLRRLTAFAMDAALCVLSVWLAFSIRMGQWELVSTPVLTVIAVALPSWFLAAWWCGTYRSIIRSAGGGRSQISRWRA